MQKIVLLILLVVSSLVGTEPNSMDCSDTPDWLMSEADKKYLCKENNSDKKNKKANIQNEWLKVSSTLCENNDGKIENGQCEATWRNAQKICRALDARLPHIEDLSAACKSNTENLDKNIKDLEYQKCYKSQGFSSEAYYWSSTVDEVDPGKSLSYYFYVGRTMAYRQNNWFYVSCLKNKVITKNVSEKKQPLEKSYLSMSSDKTGTLIGKYFFDRIGDDDKIYLHEIEEIIEKEGKVNGNQNDIGTPIYFAAAKGQYEIVKYLINQGANINLMYKTSGTPLHSATAYGHYNIVKLLLDNNADTTLKNPFGKIAVRLTSNEKIINLLGGTDDYWIVNIKEEKCENLYEKMEIDIDYFNNNCSNKTYNFGEKYNLSTYKISQDTLIFKCNSSYLFFEKNKYDCKKGFLEANGNEQNKLTGIVYGLNPNGDGFLSIRTKPKGREVGKLYNGDKVQILSKKGKYYKIKKMSNGQVGYAHSNWIRKTSSAATASNSSSSKSGVVSGLDPNGDGFLSLRSKPEGREIGKLYNGDKLSILDKRGKWYKVKTMSAGQIGWAHGNWVRETSSTVSLTNNTGSKWITPSSSTCLSKGGKLYKSVCQANWQQAKNICSTAGGRLPSIDELKSVITDCGGEIGDTDNNENDPTYQACYKAKGFSNYYWSSSVYVSSTREAWVVGLKYGDTYSDGKNGKYYVRCVRAGQ